MSEMDANIEDKVETKLSYLDLARMMTPYFLKQWKIALITFLSILMLALISRLIPTFIGYTIDHAIKPKSTMMLQWMAMAFVALYLFNMVFSFLHIYLFLILGNKVLADLRYDLFSHIQKLPLQYFNKTPAGRILTRLTNDTSNLSELFSDGLIAVFTQVVIMISILIAMLLISAKLTLYTLISAPIFIFLSYKISVIVKDKLHVLKAVLSKMNSFLAENLNGIKVIQLYNRADKNKQLFNKVSENYFSVSLDSVRAYAYMHPVMNMFNAIVMTSVIYFSGVWTQEGLLTVGALVAFIMHAQDFIPPLRQIIEKYQQFQNSLTSAERIHNLLLEPQEIDIVNQAEQISFKNSIEVKNLNFRYKDDLPLVLKNINLLIKAKSSVALVGRTGSGKSTLVSLLQRLYTAPNNSIFFDSVPIENISLETLRNHVGIIQQDNFIFKGTLLENVTLKNPKFTFAKASQALATLGIAKPLDYKIEEKGANLSTGERQLIAFARILIFEPEILIFDEATANIDSESEKMIQHAIYKITKDRTSIIIAHRLSTVQHCDQIVLLENGEIQEVGTHHELMNKQGKYYQLASAGLKSTETAASAAGTAEP